MTEIDLGALRPSASSAWFGRRLSRLLAGGASSLEQPVTWLHHQWLQGHSCLDLSGSVLAEVAATSQGAERTQARAQVPGSWRADLAGVECVDVRAPGSLEPSSRLLVLEGDRLFLAACRHDEIVVAQALRRMASEPGRWRLGDGVGQGIGDRVRALLPEADAAQMAAVALPFGRRLGIVTGGPGTGKTTVAGCMIDAVLQQAPETTVRALAPTGKAAARMTQSLRALAGRSGIHEHAREMLRRVEATTIQHAVLSGGGRTLEAAHLVIVDECSMIDLSLMRRLLEGLGPNASLILLGDRHQLASVEAGTLLADILPDRPGHPLEACTVELVRSRRFESDGALATVAAAIRKGDADAAIAALASGGSIRLEPVTTALEAVRKAVQVHGGFQGDGRVLCGHRRGPDGSLAVNRAITRARHPGADPDPVSSVDFVGRPLLITTNDPVTRLHNGDTGVVERAADGLVARFADLGCTIPVGSLPSRETAWALTIHKSQGSEYDEVAIVLPTKASPVLTRELLYTGITRSRGRVTVIACTESLRTSIAQRIVRSSGLAERVCAV